MWKKYNGGKTNWFMYVGIILVLCAGVFLIWFLMRGETKVSGNWPEPEVSESLSCEIDDFLYPFFTYDKSSGKNAKINIIFNNDILESISLIYIMHYGGYDAVVSSEASNHAAMNLSFARDGLSADALGANYSRLESDFKMSLYAKVSEIKNGAKYFLLDGYADSQEYSMDRIRQLYENKGFSCKVVNDK